MNGAHGRLRWKDNISGDYRITAKKRGGVILWFRGERHSDWPTAKLAKMFAERHAATSPAAATGTPPKPRQP